MADKKPEDLPVGTLAQIMAADDTHVGGQPVPVPEWGMSVLIRGLTRGEVLQWYDIEDGVASETFLMSNGIVTPPMTVEQATELHAKKGHAPVRRVVMAIIELSGLAASFREDAPG